jgi:hypothetical protein
MWKIKIADSIDELNKVYRMCYQTYVEEGYCFYNPAGTYCHYPHLDTIPETSILLLINEKDEIMGTNSLTLDSPARLHVDEDFPEETEKVRQECKKEGKLLAASWRILVTDGLRLRLKGVKALIKATIELAFEKGVEVCLFSFNPKHENFYRKSLNLVTIAGPIPYEGAGGAPGILMRGDKEAVIKSKFMKENK